MLPAGPARDGMTCAHHWPTDGPVKLRQTGAIAATGTLHFAVVGPTRWRSQRRVGVLPIGCGLLGSQWAWSLEAEDGSFVAVHPLKQSRRSQDGPQIAMDKARTVTHAYTQHSITLNDPPSGFRGCERQRAGQRHLPRLSSEYYRGRAFVHWTLTIESRAIGWLTPEFHHTWLLTLLHACARYQLATPAFVLMPDHVHLLWLGLNEHGSDQRVALGFLRKNLCDHLSPAAWQRQPFDHVLRGNERGPGAFETAASYIINNPVRAQLAVRWQEYPYLGCCVPGYPEFEIRAEEYWERFWRCYNHLVELMNS